MKCDDGTIRNLALNQCLTTDSTSGTGKVSASNCVYFPEIPNYQKWNFLTRKTFVDEGGINQTLYEIVNK